MPWVLMSSVLPSGTARATASAAITPPAPGRLSITMVWPLRAISSARMRTSASMAPPAGTDTTTRIVRTVCAHVEAETATASRTTATITTDRMKDPLEILAAQRIDDVPELLAVLVEDQLVLGRHRGPRSARNLAFELARCPARIAKQDHALLRALADADVAQDLPIHGHRHATIDVKRLCRVIVRTVNDEAELGLHRAAREQAHRSIHRRSLVTQRLKELRQRTLSSQPIDDQPERAILVVPRHQDHGALEARIAHRGRRHQELAGERNGLLGRLLRRDRRCDGDDRDEEGQACDQARLPHRGPHVLSRLLPLDRLHQVRSARHRAQGRSWGVDPTQCA